jgi:outer membrane protein
VSGVARARASRPMIALMLFITCGYSTVALASDLHELYLLALVNDPIYQSANFVLQAARQQRPEAFSALLPSIIGTGSASRTFGKTTYTGIPEVDRSFDSDQWVVQLTQPLLRVQNNILYGEAKAAVEEAVAQYAAAEQDLILRLARAYFDVVVAERHIGVAQAQVTALSEQLHAARRSFEAGVASITDVDDTQSRAALAEAQLEGAVNDREAARATLEAIIGEPPPPLSELKKGAVLPRPIPDDPAQWVSRALEDSPLVKASSAAVTVADWELRRSEVQRLPTVDLVASYGGNYSSGNITEPTNFGTNVKDRQVSIQVSVPLLEGGALRAHIAEARAKRSKAQADLSGAQRQATLNTRQSYAAILSGVSQVRALETAVAAGRNAVKGNKVGYGLGIRINSDVLNAEQQLYSSIQDLEKARYDTLFEGLKLKAAAGELSADDLNGVNSLLEVVSDVGLPENPAKERDLQ